MAQHDRRVTQRAPQRGRDRVVHLAKTRPVRRGLERLDQHPDVEHRVSQVRRVEAPGGPGSPGLLADALATELREHRRHRGTPRGHRRGGPLVAGDHQAPTGRAPADRLGVGQVDGRLGLVGEAQHGRQELGLGELTDRVGTGVEGRPAPALVDPHLRQRPDPDGHRRDHPERPLGAEEQLAEIGAGGTGRRMTEDDVAGRRGDLEARHQGVEATVARRRLAAGAGRREAADGGVLERLREVAERQAVLGQERLGLRAAQPRLEGGGHRHRVDREQPLQPDEVEAEHTGEARRGERRGRR